MRVSLWYIIVSFWFIGLSSCSQNQTQEKHSDIKGDPPVYLVKDSSVTIYTDVGEIVFKGRPSAETEISIFQFIEHKKSINYCVIEGSYWEHYENYLIDTKSGNIDTLWTQPRFSPNDSLLTCKSMDYGLEGIPNGIQIWELTPERKWVKIIEINQRIWIPKKIIWLDNTQIKLSKISIDSYIENTTRIISDTIIQIKN